MSAHPMLQPVDWSRPPDALEQAMPEVRRKLYQIVWDCALACTLVPPILVHARSLYQCGPGVLAVAAVAPTPGRKGYWRFRQDFPAASYRTYSVAPAKGALDVGDVRLVPAAGLTLGGLIEAMELRGIGTASSTAKLLKDLLAPEALPSGASALLVKVTDTAAGSASERPVIQVSEQGQSQLARWRQHRLIGQAETISGVVDAVAKGETGYRAGLNLLATVEGENDPAVEAAARYIDRQCERWRGLGRGEGLKALMLAGLEPLHYEGLPQWLDPEHLLAKDHPLRALRLRMEADLATRREDWRVMTAQARALARLEWLESHPDECKALVPELRGPAARFSALRYWLTGLKEAGPGA